MKRNILLLVFMLNFIWASAQFSGSGNGTASDPYLIYNETQLSQLSNFLNQEGVFFKLMKDLDLTDWIAENNPSQGWLPIGVESAPFKGIFFGNNKKISGLSINRNSLYNVGFWGYLNGATIQDLTIAGTSVVGGSYVGAFAGRTSNSTIKNCSLTLSNTVGVRGSSSVGGFIGYNDNSTISGINISTTVSGSTQVGGFCGTDSIGQYNNINVLTGVTASSDAGGLIGLGKRYILSGITVEGNIGRAYCSSTGGLIGKSEGEVTLTNCKHKGTVNGKLNVGGILGCLETLSNVILTNCKSESKIDNLCDYTGGIIGANKGFISSIERCSHFGDINGVNYVGGVIGGTIFVEPETPILHKYFLRGIPRGQANYATHATYYEQISSGYSITKSILGNCVVIGNIGGQKYVGGIIGEDLYQKSYVPVPYTFGIYTSSNLTLHSAKHGAGGR